ncbi:MAG: threonine/serine exporter family protein [Myxococcota bacterium]
MALAATFALAACGDSGGDAHDTTATDSAVATDTAATTDAGDATTTPDATTDATAVDSADSEPGDTSAPDIAPDADDATTTPDADDATATPDADATTDADDATDAGDTATGPDLAGACPLATRLGGFQVVDDGEFGYAEGTISDSVLPVAVLEVVATDAECTLYQKKNPFCSPPCNASQTCDYSGTCIPYPAPQDLGDVTLTGLDGGTVVMHPVQPGNLYYATDIPYPPWTAGAALQLTTAGGAFAALTLDGVAPTAFTPTETTWSLSAGQPLTVHWDAPTGPVATKVELQLLIDQHGNAPGSLRCLFDDDGEGTVSAAILDQLRNLGISGFPSGKLTRQTVDSTAVGERAAPTSLRARRARSRSPSSATSRARRTRTARPAPCTATSPTRPVSTTDEALVLALGSALHTAGAPAHRLEETLERLTEHLGIEAQFFSTPTALIIGFGPLARQHTRLIRVEPAELDLGRLDRLDATIRHVTSGELAAIEALAEIERGPCRAPVRPGPVGLVIVYVLLSATSAPSRRRLGRDHHRRRGRRGGRPLRGGVAARHDGRAGSRVAVRRGRLASSPRPPSSCPACPSRPTSRRSRRWSACCPASPSRWP